MKRYPLLFWIALAPLALQAQEDASEKPVERTRKTYVIETPQAVRVVPNEARKKVDVYVGERLFTSYIYSDNLKRPALFPIQSAGENPITRGYPLAPRPYERVDHSNQVGMWFAYGSVNGIDFWNDEKNPSPASSGPYGTIKHRFVKVMEDGLVAKLEVESDWLDPKGVVLLTETTVYEFEGSNTTRTISRNTKLVAKEDVTLKDHRDGIIGLRLCRALEVPNEDKVLLTNAQGKGPAAWAMEGSPSGLFVNSESVFDDSVYRKRTEWMMIKGRIGTEAVSLVLMDHAKNLGHPTYWNTRGSGLLAANPLGTAVFSQNQEMTGKKLLRGESLVFKHRLRIQSGQQMMEDDCQRFYTEFSRPPAVEELY